MVLLLRHGETHANKTGKVRPKDAQLDAAGQQAADDAAQAAHGAPLTAIVTSPLPRAKETAERWAKVAGVPVQVDPDLRARDMGALEGKPVTAVKTILDKMADQPDLKPPGKGESVKTFIESRYWPAVSKLIDAPELYGVVGHGSGVKAIELMLNKIPLTAWAKEPTIKPGQFALVTKDGFIPLVHGALHDQAAGDSQAAPARAEGAASS